MENITVEDLLRSDETKAPLFTPEQERRIVELALDSYGQSVANYTEWVAGGKKGKCPNVRDQYGK